MKSPQPLRVALICPRFSPEIGGVETHVYELGSRLVRRGHRVTVYTGASAQVVAEFGAIADLDGMQVRRFRRPLPSVPDIPSAAFAREITYGLSGFDVVHAHNYHAPQALLAAGARCRGPLVLTPHYHGAGSSPLTDRLHRVYRHAGRRMMRAADAVIAVSHVERSLLAAHFGPAVGARTVVIPNGIRVRSRREPFDVGDARVVLSVGRHETYKRIDLLIRAVGELPEVRLVICGDGPARPALERLTHELGLGRRVTFTGRVSEDELSRWMSTAAVFATLSTREAFGLALAEATAFGLPSVATDIPAHEEVASLGGSVTLVRGPIAPAPQPGEQVLVGAVSRALGSAARLGTATPVAVLSWDDVTQRVEETYRRVVSSAGQPVSLWRQRRLLTVSTAPRAS